MKNTPNHNGSMVLTCMFFISICMMIMLLHWRSQEAIQTTMIMRVKMTKAQYAAEALLQYGIDLCKKRYALLAQTLSDRKRPITITFARWPLGNEQYAQGTLEISYTKQFMITATLTQEGNNTITLSCCLDRESELRQDVFTITAWKWHEVNNKA